PTRADLPVASSGGTAANPAPAAPDKSEGRRPRGRPGARRTAPTSVGRGGCLALQRGSGHAAIRIDGRPPTPIGLPLGGGAWRRGHNRPAVVPIALLGPGTTRSWLGCFLRRPGPAPRGRGGRAHRIRSAGLTSHRDPGTGSTTPSATRRYPRPRRGQGRSSAALHLDRGWGPNLSHLGHATNGPSRFLRTERSGDLIDGRGFGGAHLLAFLPVCGRDLVGKGENEAPVLIDLF